MRIAPPFASDSRLSCMKNRKPAEEIYSSSSQSISSALSASANLIVQVLYLGRGNRRVEFTDKANTRLLVIRNNVDFHIDFYLKDFDISIFRDYELIFLTSPRIFLSSFRS